MTNNWRKQEFYLLKAAILLGLFVSWLTFRYLRFPLPLVVVTFLFIFLLVYDRTASQRQGMTKTYPASLNDTRQVVLNVLNEKGMPYGKEGEYIFVIEDEVEIRLLPSHSRHMRRTAVSLIPKNPESQQLIFSLRQKLDEAFRPRGL